MTRLLAPLLLVFGCLAFAGCSTSGTRKVMPLDRFQRIFVEQRFNENHGLDAILVAELRRLGKEASSGPRTMTPDNADAVLTYDARWEWDFKTYLVDFTFELHTHPLRKKLADGHCRQPSPRAKPPAEVIHSLLSSLFAPP